MPHRKALLAGERTPLSGAVPAALIAAGYTLADAPPAGVLLNLDPQAEPDAVVARCQQFAAQAPDGAVILALLEGGADWQAARRLACLSAFTRQFAKDWAKRGMRMNTIAVGVNGPAGWNAAAHDSGSVRSAPATAKDIARVVIAVLGFPSMTGQLIRLGG